ncbi:MAG: hypothetical protein ACODAE_11405 [Gemmatimonadota bacterium]
MLTAIAFLAAGLAWPQAAEGLLRLLLATLAVGFIVARAYEAMQPVRPRADTGSPFEGGVADRPPPEAPHVLRRLTKELAAADDARKARRTPVPRSVRWAVIDELSRRLAERHGLSLDDPADHERIRALVSEPTWSLVGPRGAVSDPGTRPRPGTRRGGDGRAGGRGPVYVSELDRILDDLERL